MKLRSLLAGLALGSLLVSRVSAQDAAGQMAAPTPAVATPGTDLKALVAKVSAKARAGKGRKAVAQAEKNEALAAAKESVAAEARERARGAEEAVAKRVERAAKAAAEAASRKELSLA